MMAEKLYAQHREYAATLGIKLPEWDKLTPREMIEWDEQAFEQECRDRPALQEVEPYDPYSF